MIKTIILCLTLLQPLSKIAEPTFQHEAVQKYEQQVLKNYTLQAREIAKYKGTCYIYSIELIKLLRQDCEQCVLMGLYTNWNSVPYHYYVFSRRWGAIDVYPEGHLDEPLNGIILDEVAFRVPPYIDVPKAKENKFEPPMQEKPDFDKIYA